MQVYFLPGLGFDSRIFKKLVLPNAATFYLEWIEPTSLQEGIGDYAARMATGIHSSNNPIILIGHSFGGVLCQEIARIKKVHKIILISSIASRTQLPFSFKIMKPTGLYRLFTKFVALNSFWLWGKSQGYSTREEQQLFKDMINRQSDTYLQWALKQLSAWQESDAIDASIIQVHGDYDKTFPISLIKKPNYVVPKGDHFMVYKEPSAISEIINKELSI